jgi:hypothetical protein
MSYISLCIDGGGFCFVYYCRLFLFLHSHDCNPYPIAFRWPIVVVLFLQTPSHGRWLILIVFSPKYPKIQSLGGHNINMYCMVVA